MTADAGAPIGSQSGSRAAPIAPTPGMQQARATTTRTPVGDAPAPAPDPSSVSGDQSSGSDRSPFGRWRERNRGRLAVARRPLPGPAVLRVVTTTLLSVLCLLTLAGAALMLLLWQQDRSSGVLTSQLERTWDLFDVLRQIERVVAFAAVPVAMAWIVMATINVRRAVGRRRNPVVAALSLPVGLFGVWAVGAEVVAEADDWVGQGAGFVLQAVLAAVPLLSLERVTEAAEGRHGPLRASYLIGVALIAQIQFLGGLSTIDPASPPDRWARLGAYLVIGALLEVLGTLSVTEAARSVEDATDHRFRLRQRFGESLLAQVEHDQRAARA